MKKWLTLTILAVVAAVFLYTSVDVWFLDEEAPESFAVADSGGCYDDGYGNVVCEDSVPWEPYCEVYEDEYGTYSECYDYPGGEPLCTYPDGPFWDSQGEPYYVATWDYCAALEWEDPDAITIPFLDYTIPPKMLGTLTSGGMIPLGLKVVNVLTGKAGMKKAIKDALKEQLNHGP